MVKKTKKEKKVAKVANPIEDLIKNADSGIIVTARNGNIEVTGIKNINFAYEAKGLLVGAMDSYTIRPIANMLNSYTNNTLAQLTKAVKEANKK